MKCPHCGEEIIFTSDQLNIDKAIELYYRSRARGSRITMRDIADRTGFSYSYIRERKVEYDRAGKWGAKHKVKP